ncbi:ABC transporter substrate-binding protein [Pseudomonas sp. KU26590]|uniref:ABC transporter substrate-binding protein n=1 Tax=Pseudomonas sp. KU26590 TaxID=2991051 RepID=UPI00223D689F|nr:ABC transporter substrate-binding protein [Pseudomonas sp. KU26590]UZJ58741.1 ABC transporter substrate-binding protein [Pseudomonas sp. KU26590]
MRRLLSALLLAGLSASALADPGDAGQNIQASALTPRQVQDDGGQAVSIATEPARIADAWYAHHVLLMTLGAGARIVATVNHPASQPWMFKVLPALNQATAIEGTAFNAENLLAEHVDLVFTALGDRQAVAYRQLGLPVMQMGYTDLAGLKRSMLNTAEALGGAEPRTRALAYNGFLDQQLAEVNRVVAGIPPEQRPKVLHIASVNPFKVDGADTLIDDWIKIAGGRNAATGLKGNMQIVSAEQLLAWQPDVVILAANAGRLDQAAQPQLLNQLEAVRNGRVLRNPAGVFPWDRYGTEVALQVAWAAQQLHPALFRDVDMAAQTMDFYRRFFDYPLTPEDAQRMLHGEPPATAP